MSQPPQPPYGQPPYGQPPYGAQPPYGGQPYGQPGYGAPGYGPPPGYQGPPGPQGPRQGRSSGTVVALVLAGLIVLAGIGVVLFLLLGDDDSPTATATATTGATSAAETSSTGASSSSSAGTTSGGPVFTVPPPGASPDGLGDDPALDERAQACYDGDMSACDDLVETADQGSDYWDYGDTCGGRQPAGTGVWCVFAFPEL